MNFGELREAVHRKDWSWIADADLTPEGEGYVDRMVGIQIKRYRAARPLMELEGPLSHKVCRAASRMAEGRLDGVLRWYACDVTSEAMRLYGNGDSRSLRAIEVIRQYVLGEVGEEELKRAHQAARAASYDARAADAAVRFASYAATSAASYAAGAAAGDAAGAYADAAASAAYAAGTYGSWDRANREKKAQLTDWLRAYLMRWIEEGDWWEVSS